MENIKRPIINFDAILPKPGGLKKGEIYVLRGLHTGIPKTSRPIIKTEFKTWEL